MRKTIYIFIAILSVFIISSCEDDKNDTVIIADASPTITTPAIGEKVILSKKNAANDFVFAWDETDYGFSTSVLYRLTMAVGTNDFDNSIKVGTTTNDTTLFTVSYFNNLLISEGFMPGQEGIVKLRLTSFVNDLIEDTSSPILEFYATPYEVPVSKITSPVTEDNYVLLKSELNELMTFEWTATDYGISDEIVYSLQMDVAGNGFEDNVEVLSLTETTGSITVEDLNNILVQKKGFNSDVEVSVEFRIEASVKGYKQNLYSESIALNLTPYSDDAPIVVDYPMLQVPGDYQGWDVANNSTVVYSINDDGIYEGYIYFAEDAANFKYAENNSWDVSYGDTDADGTLDDVDGVDIVAGLAGMYFLHADLNTSTHTFEIRNWGLIGSATSTGWEADTDMIYDAENNVLTITADLIVGGIKFRANDAWDVDLGDNGADSTLEQGGDDIPIAEAGNYTITLDLSKAIFTYSIVKN